MNRRGVLQWIDRHIEESILIPFTGIMVLILFIEVLKRYLFGNASAYVDEIARTLFIYVVFLGVPLGVARNNHILIDVLPDKLPVKVTFYIGLFSNIVSLLFCGFFAYIGYTTIRFLDLMGIRTIALELPKSLYMACIPIGFLGACIRIIQRIVLLVRDYKRLSE